MKKKNTFSLAILALMILSLVACGGGSSGGGGGTETTTTTETNNTNDTQQEKTAQISGQVTDAKTSLPIDSAIVSANGVSTTSTSTGNYTLDGVTLGDRVVVTITKDGYAEQSKIVSLTTESQNADLAAKLLPVDLIQAFDPDTAQVLTVSGSPASVTLNATALVKDDGTVPDGNATISLTVIDPTTDIELMPGDLQTDTGTGTLSQLESFGAITATFTDDSGNDLNLAEGSVATIRIPVADKSGNPPATIPLYYYDEIKGLWVEEGSAALDASKTYYEGTVTHFSTWNADKVYDRVTINGCVEDTSGKRLENVFVYSSGKDYTGRAFAYTDASGNFSVYAKSNAMVSVYGRQSFRTTNVVDVTTTTSDITMAACLVLQNKTTGNTDGGGTLTLSGEDTGIVGTSLVFNDAVNFYDYLNAYYIYAGEEQDLLDSSSTPVDPNNTFYLYSVGDVGDVTSILYIVVGGQTYAYVCGSGTTYASCGNVSYDTTNNSVTFTNAVLQRYKINSTGTGTELVNLTVNGTIKWRNYSVYAF